jgi:integrase
VTVAQALLGHSRPSMTLDVYSYTTKDALERAAETLESLF